MNQSIAGASSKDTVPAKSILNDDSIHQSFEDDLPLSKIKQEVVKQQKLQNQEDLTSSQEENLPLSKILSPAEPSVKIESDTENNESTSNIKQIDYKNGNEETKGPHTALEGKKIAKLQVDLPPGNLNWFR